MTVAQSATGQRDPLFDASFLRTLEPFRIATRRSLAGLAVGQRRSPAMGSSVEFADFRTYAPGDDYRRIDWNVYARLQRLFLRLYRADENLSLTVLLDTSASMLWGEPPKIRMAGQIAGAVAFIAMQSEDTVSLATCRGGAINQRLDHVSGRAGISRAWSFLQQAEFGGNTDLDASLAVYARTVRGRGMSVVVSDLLSTQGFSKGVDALLNARQEVVLVHVLAPEELDPRPDMLGDWRLLDAETQRALDVTISPALLRSYREHVSAYVDDIAAFCRKRGVTYVLVSSDVPLREVLTRTLRQAGVLA